jgi:hypothetical protein
MSTVNREGEIRMKDKLKKVIGAFYIFGCIIIPNSFYIYISKNMEAWEPWVFHITFTVIFWDVLLAICMVIIIIELVKTSHNVHKPPTAQNDISKLNSDDFNVNSTAQLNNQQIKKDECDGSDVAHLETRTFAGEDKELESKPVEWDNRSVDSQQDDSGVETSTAKEGSVPSTFPAGSYNSKKGYGRSYGRY